VHPSICSTNDRWNISISCDWECVSETTCGLTGNHVWGLARVKVSITDSEWWKSVSIWTSDDECVEIKSQLENITKDLSPLYLYIGRLENFYTEPRKPDHGQYFDNLRGKMGRHRLQNRLLFLSEQGPWLEDPNIGKVRLAYVSERWFRFSFVNCFILHKLSKWRSLEILLW